MLWYVILTNCLEDVWQDKVGNLQFRGMMWSEVKLFLRKQVRYNIFQYLADLGFIHALESADIKLMAL